jgi:UDP-glucose 4-epimerase
MISKTYLVTGAAGFIGAALAKQFIEQGSKVVTIDNLSTGFRESIPEGVIFIEGNCQDESIINQLNSYQFDAIFHIAGQSSGEISFEDPVYDLQTNAQSTLLLLKYALKTNCKKFIYASTMSVYGDQPDIPITEEASTLPKSFYAVGKLASEHYLDIYSKYSIDIVALRLFNVYGPGQNMENLKQGMASIYLAQALTNKKIIVKGSAERYRDFVFIDDVVRAFIQTGIYNDGKYRVFNIGTSERTTVSELIEKIKSNLQFDVKVEFNDPTIGDQFGIYANIDKAITELGWSPKISLDDGIKIFCKAVINNG